MLTGSFGAIIAVSITAAFSCWAIYQPVVTTIANLKRTKQEQNAGKDTQCNITKVILFSLLPLSQVFYAWLIVRPLAENGLDYNWIHLVMAVGSGIVVGLLEGI